MEYIWIAQLCAAFWPDVYCVVYAQCHFGTVVEIVSCLAQDKERLRRTVRHSTTHYSLQIIHTRLSATGCLNVKGLLQYFEFCSLCCFWSFILPDAVHLSFNYLLGLADSLLHLGAAWVYIGMLRFQLLLSSYNPDPAFLSAFMHSQILEKISLLDLKGKVKFSCLWHIAPVSCFVLYSMVQCKYCELI